jgi:gamma-glutamyltranspeptidase/glutathione hydrolase
MFLSLFMRFPMIRVCRAISVVLAALLCCAPAAQSVAQAATQAAVQVANSSRAAIASAHPLATAAGEAVLAQGGNAFDAAVAVAAALAVVEPYSSGLGGGGFFLLHRAADGHQVMIDARETAPAGILPRHLSDAAGNPLPGATTRGGTAAAIPGLPAGLAHLARHYGRLPLATTLAPAMQLARDGFRTDRRYARIAQLREAMLRATPETALFLDDGRAPAPGYVLRQPDLAATLQRIAGEGAAGFYRGPVAEGMTAAINAAGGVWQMSDLAAYRVAERVPVRFSYRGATITAAALPSAGGIALAQMLGMLEHFSQGAVQNPEYAHLVVETLRRAFRDRMLLGDPDQVAVPVAELLEKDKLKQYVASVRQDRATPLPPPGATGAGTGSVNTTHFSIVDAAGNRVAATLSINLLFGSGIVGRGTGVLLNNEMDDFTLRADVANSFQLRGGVANSVAPGKRPLSSMTPTFVEDDKGVLVLGAPGGSRIISQVLLAALEYLRKPQVDLKQLVAMPRYHHQYWPDRIEIEPEGFSAAWRSVLEGKGHRLHVASRKWGNLQAVFQPRDGGAAQAANDPRGGDVAWY